MYVNTNDIEIPTWIPSGVWKKAIEEVKKSTCYPYRVSAVIFKGGRILSFGHNRIRSPKKVPYKYRKTKCSIHAEQDAILSCSSEQLKGAKIFVLRVNQNSGSISMARPCIFCESMIRDVGITKVFYTTHERQIVREKFH